ncbi:hypothetical protein GGR55DRAFT_677265 [Xylaria sp. FL0064]|nr:hypothetical protein GGR55DRAFT_677265 [Xylaria sp. FL0064]
MKFLTFFAIGGFLTSALAGPIAVSSSVEKRQDYDALQATLTTLFADIQKQTAIINSTIDAVPENSTDTDATADAAAIVPQLQTITDLLTAVNGTVVKRAVVEASFGKPDLFKTLSLIIFELLFTVKKILFKLGLGKVVIYLTPLVLALKSLVFSLDLVVGGVLLAVGPTVNELLKAVGLALIGL